MMVLIKKPMDDLIKSGIEKRIKSRVVKFQRIKVGGNNKLFKLITRNNKNYLLKIYGKDKINRLDREFRAIKLLRDKGFDNVPIPHLSNNELDYGLYSYEEGITKISKQLTRNDLRLMAEFMADIHNIRSQSDIDEFPPANLACFSLMDYVNNIEFRIEKFVSYAESTSAPQSVKELYLKESMVLEIYKLLNFLIGKVDKNILNKKLKKKAIRLSPVDFGSHNIIFKKGGKAIFVDFEYFGRDDPDRAVADFLMHDKSKDIKKEFKKYFEDIYLKRAETGQKRIKRLELVKKIVAIEWLAIYLYSMTPEKIEFRKFSDPDFNEALYLGLQYKKTKEHLREISRFVNQI